ncbi:hypothetical protein HDU97_009338 [Phlyctochytrium planicorne]|nr:hypothetical protein HDU97_009338 [Phlyctochytrium planicorne]
MLSLPSALPTLLLAVIGSPIGVSAAFNILAAQALEKNETQQVDGNGNSNNPSFIVLGTCLGVVALGAVAGAAWWFMKRRHAASKRRHPSILIEAKSDGNITKQPDHLHLTIPSTYNDPPRTSTSTLSTLLTASPPGAVPLLARQELIQPSDKDLLDLHEYVLPVKTKDADVATLASTGLETLNTLDEVQRKIQKMEMWDQGGEPRKLKRSSSPVSATDTLLEGCECCCCLGTCADDIENIEPVQSETSSPSADKGKATQSPISRPPLQRCHSAYSMATLANDLREPPHPSRPSSPTYTHAYSAADSISYRFGSIRTSRSLDTLNPQNHQPLQTSKNYKDLHRPETPTLDSSPTTPIDLSGDTLQEPSSSAASRPTILSNATFATPSNPTPQPPLQPQPVQLAYSNSLRRQRGSIREGAIRTIEHPHEHRRLRSQARVETMSVSSFETRGSTLTRAASERSQASERTVGTAESLSRYLRRYDGVVEE